MSKSIKLKDNNYWDSEGIVHNQTPLKTVLNNVDTDISNINTAIGNLYNFKHYYYAGKTLNINDLINPGYYTLDVNNTYTNAPPRNNYLDFLIVLSNGSNRIQFWFNSNVYAYFRVCNWGTWTAWKKISIS